MNAHVSIPATVAGHISYQLVNRAGKVEQEGECKNLILNSGLDYLMSGYGLGNMAAYIAVGTGTSAPAPTQVGLDREIGRTAYGLDLVTGKGAQRFGGGHFTVKFGVAFDYNEGNGNLTEFGASNGTGSGTFTRALFRDGNGNPIVITKTSDTRLVIYYTLEIFITPVTSVNTNINIDGIGQVNVNYLMCERDDPYWGYGCLELFRGGNPSIQFYQREMNMAQDEAGLYVSGISSHGGPEPYVSGSFTRTVSGERPPESSDVTLYGYTMGWMYDGSGNARNQTYMKVKFNTPIVKSGDYRLKLSAQYSIARDVPQPQEEDL